MILITILFVAVVVMAVCHLPLAVVFGGMAVIALLSLTRWGDQQ